MGESDHVSFCEAGVGGGAVAFDEEGADDSAFVLAVAGGVGDEEGDC